MKQPNEELFDSSLLRELSAFENFFQQAGFKRIDGAIYGVLVLSARELASEDIEKILGLSQSATSMALKNLTHFNAIESTDDRERRCKLHRAKEDSLSVVASIFRKREQQNIEDFKAMANRILSNPKYKDSDPENVRTKRLKSIIMSCEMAESIMKFVIGLSQFGEQKQYFNVIRKLPQALELITAKAEPLASFTTNLKNNITHRFFKTSGEMK